MVLVASASSGNSNFLIPNGTFVVELVMFIVVLGVVAKFILPPLQRAMSERDETVRSGLAAGDDGRREAARLDTERAAVLAAAHTEARGIVEEATREVDRLREDAQRRAQEVYSAELSAATVRIDDEGHRLRSETLARLEGIVVTAAERIVGVRVDADRHRTRIAEAIDAATSGREE